MSDTASFVYLTCQPGAEKWVKEDIAARHPEWRFAFSRPGFVTFKTAQKVGLGLERPSIFVRQWGVCLGWTSTLHEGLDFGRQHMSFDVIHVFSRDAIAHGEDKFTAPAIAEDFQRTVEHPGIRSGSCQNNRG